MPPRKAILLISIIVAASASGCAVQRTIHIESDPPGALVWMNNQEIGRTPLNRDFTWYGNYDVIIRAEGYETLKTKTWVVAPIWQWPPFDLFAELWPGRLRDERRLHYTLEPATTQPADAETVLSRAVEMREQLQSRPRATP